MPEFSHKRPHIVWFHKYEMSIISKSTEIKSRLLVTWSWHWRGGRTGLPWAEEVFLKTLGRPARGGAGGAVCGASTQTAPTATAAVSAAARGPPAVAPCTGRTSLSHARCSFHRGSRTAAREELHHVMCVLGCPWRSSG